MGTNYYLYEKPACACCGREFGSKHIGKSSGGWCFSLEMYHLSKRRASHSGHPALPQEAGYLSAFLVFFGFGFGAFGAGGVANIRRSTSSGLGVGAGFLGVA